VPYATPSRVVSSRREYCAPAVHDVSSVGSNRKLVRAAQLWRSFTSVGRPAGTSTSSVKVGGKNSGWLGSLLTEKLVRQNPIGIWSVLYGPGFVLIRTGGRPPQRFFT
jgi:hypothetical protein